MVPFFLPAASFLAGILLWQMVPLKAAAYFLFWAMPALWFMRGRKGFPLLFALIWFLLGALYAAADRQHDPNSIAHAANGKETLLLGTVESLPEIKTQGRKVSLSFVLEVSPESGKGSGRVQVFLINSGKIPAAGSKVWVLGKLDRPKNRPGQVFDYARYLYSQGIETVLYGFGGRSLRISAPGKNSFIEKVRGKINARIDAVSSGRSAIIFKALILGTRGSVDTTLKEAFFKTGTSHLLAISGLNIALAAGSFYLCLIMFGLDRRWAGICAVFFTFFQVLISGSGFPVLRAGWMAGGTFLAVLLGRPKHSLNLFFLALLLVLLPNTRAVYSVSFQLSFLSVFAMIVCFPWWEESRFKDLWAVPLAVFLGTFPAVLYHFGGVSLVSWPANFFAIPLFHFTLLSLLTALLFSWLPLVSKFLFAVPDFFLNGALSWIMFCAKIPYSYVYLPRPNPVWILFYYLIFLGIVWLKNFEGENFKRSARRRSEEFLKLYRRYCGRNEEETRQNKGSRLF